MYSFKADSKIHLAYELKSWLITIILVFFLFFLSKLFLPHPNEFVFGIVLLLKLANTLVQSHIKQIDVNSQANQITFILSSIMSGEKRITYDLGGINSVLKENPLFTKALFSPNTLMIFLQQEEVFQLTSQYGFSTKTLREIDQVLKDLHQVSLPKSLL